MQNIAIKNRIIDLFQTKQEDILNVYFTAGYPKLEDTTIILKTLAAAGADMLEIGMPYSDPLADGETIQQSSMQALKNGMSLEVLFKQLKGIRSEAEIPLLLMGYFNQVMQYGVERFCQKCKEIGIDGVILPDLPMLEYEESYKAIFEKYNLSFTFLVTPQTNKTRIQKIDELSNGFIYIVSSAATTGKQKGISEVQKAYFERIKKAKLQNPTLIGFGISDNQSFTTACEYANGAIIGSAFIRAVSEEGDLKEKVKTFVKRVLGK